MLHTLRSTVASLVLLVATNAVPAQDQAVSFVNGAIDHHIDVAYAPGLFPRRGITVECWMTYDDTTLPVGGWRWPTIVRQDVTAGVTSYFLRVGASTTNNLNLEWAYDNGTALRLNVYRFASRQFTTWTHVACTYDGQQSVIYINGMPVSTQPVSGVLRDNMGLLRIGNGDVSAAGHEVWNGSIDELRIWPFARSQSEILATMNDELLFCPGLITFNLNGNYRDSSSNFMGTVTGTVPFVAGTGLLTARTLGAFASGHASTTCNQRLGATVGSRSFAGNADFAFVGYDGSANTPGALLLSGGTIPVGFPILGIDVFLDPFALVGIDLPVTTRPNGSARVPVNLVGIPTGVGAAGQFVFLDSVCGSQGVTASNAVSVAVQ